MKMETWTCRCLLGVPVDPWITKMVTQGTKLEHQGVQNPSFVYKKSSISVVNQPALPRSQGGRRQGRSLKIIHHTLYDIADSILFLL